MYEDFKEGVKEKADQNYERDLLNRAVVKDSVTSRISKATTYKFNDIDNVIDAVKFEHPTAAFIQIINLNKIDAQGYPEVNTRKIRDIQVTASSTNTFNTHGKLIGANVNNVSFNYRLVLVFVKDGAYKMITQNINGECNRGFY